MDRYLRLSVNDYEFTHAGPCGSGVFISAGTFRKTGFIRRKNVIKWKDIKGGRNMVIRETKKEDLKQVMEIIRMADRKSTRLNSSHVSISYAVFCLKKKKETKKT